jgi:hypothetical protein
LMPIPKNRLSATNAAFGDGGIHTQWPKIIAKLFIAAAPHDCIIPPSPRTAPAVRFQTLSRAAANRV